jgi:hypothetical protein
MGVASQNPLHQRKEKKSAEARSSERREGEAPGPCAAQATGPQPEQCSSAGISFQSPWLQKDQQDHHMIGSIDGAALKGIVQRKLRSVESSVNQ